MAHKVALETIIALRNKTSVSMGEVKKALETAAASCPSANPSRNGCHCETKALASLRERGAQIAEKRQGRATGQGRVAAYIHHDGKMGALVEVNCETDFVARTDDFATFIKDLALHVAAMAPQYVKVEDVPAGTTLSDEDRKAQVLLEQPFVQDQGTTVGDLLKALIAKTGENVVIKRFVRFGLGE
jgi:elongation factor Ts